MNQRHRLIWWDRLGFAFVVLGILFILLFAGCDTRSQEPGRFMEDEMRRDNLKELGLWRGAPKAGEGEA